MFLIHKNSLILTNSIFKVSFSALTLQIMSQKTHIKNTEQYILLVSNDLGMPLVTNIQANVELLIQFWLVSFLVKNIS